jgi:hypothetical protein
MGDKHIDFPKGPGVKQGVDSLAGAKFALFFVLGDGFLAAHPKDLFFFFLERIDSVFRNPH